METGCGGGGRISFPHEEKQVVPEEVLFAIDHLCEHFLAVVEDVIFDCDEMRAI